MPFFLHEKPKSILYSTVLVGFIGVVLLLQPVVNQRDVLAGARGLLSGMGAALAYIHVKQ